MTAAAAIRFTILGQPCSKANTRSIVTVGRGTDHQRPAVIKSKAALAYERDALRQIPPSARQRLQGPVRVTIRIWYRTELPDLDASVILDCLQDRWAKRPTADPRRPPAERALAQAGVYRNDRQVRELHLFHAIDAANPRADICVEPITLQQALLGPLHDSLTASPSLL